MEKKRLKTRIRLSPKAPNVHTKNFTTLVFMCLHLNPPKLVMPHIAAKQKTSRKAWAKQIKATIQFYNWSLTVFQNKKMSMNNWQDQKYLA